ncbi:MAG: hypothetical protein M3P87_06860 [Actinomycetota bacterium]|nr:hypothetical protein [Actinomycetota bacterium]
MEAEGIVHMRGETSRTIPVKVFADSNRLRLLSGNELIGEWAVKGMGIHALNEGFAIRAEGEELILKTDNDVALAEELGLLTASPRLARRIAASHNVEQAAPLPEPATPTSNLAAIAFALGGVLILAGGVVLRAGPALVGLVSGPLGPYWLAFSIGGSVMVAIAYLLGRGVRWAQIAAVLAIVGLIAVFALAVQDVRPDANDLMAYGFIAGGIIVGVSVLFSGTLIGDR